MIDLSGAVLSLTTGTYTVRRRGPTAYGVDGKAVAPIETTFTVRGLLQPISGRELQLVPEGNQNDELRSFWTTKELRTVAAAGGPDIVVAGGEAFKVLRCHAWDAQGKFWHTVLVLLDTP